MLGIDCGSQATGYGLIESDGYRHRAVLYGVIRPPAKQEFAQRLDHIHKKICELLIGERPDWVAVEDVFFAENARSAIKLGHVRGVVLQAAAGAGIAVAEYTPLAIKSALTGYGRAEKPQVRHMVTVLLKLNEPPSSLDASDALAVAICHIQTAGAAAAAAAGTQRR